MLTIQIRFDAAHFHATPWQNQVNEGIVEWPPSPFRLLRTIVSAAFNRTEVTSEQLGELVENLVRSPPAILAVPVAQAQSRHYMPQYGEGKTTKILDTSAVLERGGEGERPWHVAYVWESLELDSELANALSTICSQVTYFGRAESWATFAVHGDAPVTEGIEFGRMEPLLPNDAIPADARGGQVQAYPYPLPQGILERWSEEWVLASVESELAIAAKKASEKGKDFDEKKQRKKVQAKQQEKAPATVLAVLTAETHLLQKEGWSHPPGTFDVRYVRPAGTIVAPRATTVAVPEGVAPTVARFLITSRVKPPARFALYFADSMRAAVLSWVSKVTGEKVEEHLAGRENGEALKASHQHLHVFCELSRNGQFIESVVVYQPAGMSSELQIALRQPNRVVRGRGGQAAELALLTMSSTDAVAGHSHELAQTPIFETSTQWVSVTPFVSTRHTKKGKLETLPEGLEAFDATGQGDALVPFAGAGQDAKDSIPVVVGDSVSDLLRLLALNQTSSRLVRLVRFNVITPLDASARSTPCAEFRTRRQQGDGSRGQAYPVAFHLTFAEPVSGPLALGYGSHFSLGLFRALPE